MPLQLGEQPTPLSPCCLQAYDQFEEDEARKDLQLAKQQARAKHAAAKRAKQGGKKGKRNQWSESESEGGFSDSGGLADAAGTSGQQSCSCARLPAQTLPPVPSLGLAPCPAEDEDEFDDPRPKKAAPVRRPPAPKPAAAARPAASGATSMQVSQQTGATAGAAKKAAAARKAPAAAAAAPPPPPPPPVEEEMSLMARLAGRLGDVKLNSGNSSGTAAPKAAAAAAPNPTASRGGRGAAKKPASKYVELSDRWGSPPVGPRLQAACTAAACT